MSVCFRLRTETLFACFRKPRKTIKIDIYHFSDRSLNPIGWRHEIWRTPDGKAGFLMGGDCSLLDENGIERCWQLYTLTSHLLDWAEVANLINEKFSDMSIMRGRSRIHPCKLVIKLSESPQSDDEVCSLWNLWGLTYFQISQVWVP